MVNHLLVKSVLIELFIIFLTTKSCGQNSDSIITFIPISFKRITTPGPNNFNPEKQKRWITIDKVTVETFNTELTPIEEELAQVESREIRALLERDTTVLKTIWLQDFTLDEPHNKVHHDQNPLPHYLSLGRRIEQITIVDDFAYVLGFEYAVRVNLDGNVDTQIMRNYSHMWKKEFFTWSLTTKTYD